MGLQKKHTLINLSALLIFALLLFINSNISAQTYDSDYEAKIKEYTTDPRFYPESVSRIIDHPSIPSPLDHFGTIIGAPGVMHRTSEIYEYYQILADTSPNLTMEQVGTSEEGRPILLVTISSESSINDLDTYKDILAKLADPRTIDKNIADQLSREGKPVYYLNGGMHSTEMGSPEMLMELAYRLVTDPSEEIQSILENTIVILNPASEPDGRDKAVDWYYRYTKDRTEWNDGFRRSPPYWGKYVFHDNNRDGLQISQEITKAIFNIFYDWHPTVMLDLHESVPLLYISTGTGPYNENVDPITIGEWQTIANHEITSLAAQGMPGVFNWAFYDGWWPGYGIWVANNHNSIGRFYETFGNAGANTYLRDITRSRYAGDPATTREWYRPDPPAGQIYWSLRNNTNYMQAGVIASLTYAADNRVTLLKNFYQKGVNNINTGMKGDIKMFKIPANQRDQAMTAYLVNQLQRQKIEVHNTTNGDYVVQLDQPYSKLAVDLLTEQKYPKNAKFPPYDAIAWTLGYMYGVDVEALDSLAYEKNELELITEIISHKGTVSGNGSDFLLPYKAQTSVISALYDMKSTVRKMKAFVLDTVSVFGEDTVQAGSIILKGLSEKQANELAKNHSLDLVSGSFSTERTHEVSLPKVAVFHSWTNTQAEGWVRFTMEQKEIPYTSIDKDDLKNGKLKNKFDVIIIPAQGGDGASFVNGADDSFGPMPFTKTDEFPSHGTPDATTDMTGGPGYDGIANLSDFVKDGGVLIPLDNSARIIADLGIGKQVSSFTPNGLFHPGSIITVKQKKNRSPILYGYPETFHLFKGNGQLLRTSLYNRDLMVLQYGTTPLSDEKPYTGEVMGSPTNKTEMKLKTPTSNKGNGKKIPYVRSGMVRNENAIIGHGAIFNVPHGEGHVVFFTFNPLNRYLNHHDSSLLWNTMINWNDLRE